MQINSIVKNDAVNSITGFTLSIWYQHCPHDVMIDIINLLGLKKVENTIV